MSDTITHSGEIWNLGQHKLLCADAGDTALVAELMDKPAQLLFTSPPYLQRRSYFHKIDDWDALMQSVFSNLYLTENAQVLVNLGIIHKKCHVIRYHESFLNWMDMQGFKLFDWYTWDKITPNPGLFYGHLQPCNEWIFHFNKNIRTAEKTIPSKTAGQKRDLRKSKIENLINYKQRVNYRMEKVRYTYKTRVPDSVIRIPHNSCCILPGYDHPAVFPVALPEFIIPIWTDSDDIVYEPFCGSGSTIIACQKTGRICRAVELAPEFCDVILLRFHYLFPDLPIFLDKTKQSFFDMDGVKEKIAKIYVSKKRIKEKQDVNPA